MTWLGRIFHQGCERQTTVNRAVGGLATGALAGAAIVSLFALPLGPMAVFVFVFAFVIWAAGLFLIAAPGWWLLHRLGARCQQAAMIYGGGLTLVVVLGVMAWPAAWAGDGMALHAILPLLPWAFALAAVGVVVGWVVARVAYDPAVPA